MSSIDDNKTDIVGSEPNNKNIFHVSLLGSEGAGKSSFLAGLAFLGFDPLQALLKIYPQDSETARYLNSLNRAFQNGSFPPPTNITSVLNFNLHIPQNRIVMNIRLADYPGEDFRHAFNDLTPERAAQFRNHLLESDIIILLIDVADISSDNEEKQTIIHEKLRAHLNAAYEVVQHHDKTTKSPDKKIDICIGVTKCDLAPFYKQMINSSNGGGHIVRQFLNSRWQNFENILRDGTNINNIHYFGLSAVGTTDPETGKPIKGQINSFGYEPIFHWIAERSTRISSRKFTRYFLYIACIIVILTSGILLACFAKRTYTTKHAQDQLEIIDNKDINVEKKLEQTQHPANDNVINSRNNLIDSELNRLKNKIKQANNEQTLSEIREELNVLYNLGIEERKIDLDKLKTEIDNKIIVMEMTRVRDYFDSRNELFSKTAEQFLLRYPLSIQANEVRKLQKQDEDRKIKIERDRIRQMTVNNIESLQEKSQRIFGFLEKYKNRLNYSEVSAMTDAAELAKQFTERRNYSGTIDSYGGFASQVYQNVSIYHEGYNENAEIIASDSSKNKLQTVFPQDNKFTIKWQSGDKIRFEIRGKGGMYGLADAGYTDSNLISLRCLNQRIHLLPKQKPYDSMKPMRSEGYFIKCKINEISDEKWKAFDDYITPGESW